MINLDEIPSNFSFISFKEMGKAQLLDRHDTKYYFPAAKLPELLVQLESDYSILEYNGNRMRFYKTLYFDTSDFLLYKLHHNGKANRHKIRFRNYTDSQQVFFEIKLKNNKGRTIKERILCDEIPAKISGEANDFLVKLTEYNADDFKPVLWVNYHRITFVSKTVKERLTIDINLSFNFNGVETNYPGLVIAEVKRENNNFSSFVNLMQKLHIHPFSMSKYCMGICNTYPAIKQNNFKSKLYFLSGIKYENI